MAAILKKDGGVYVADVGEWHVSLTVAVQDGRRGFRAHIANGDRTHDFPFDRIRPAVPTLPDYSGGAEDAHGRVRLYGYLADGEMTLEIAEEAHADTRP